MIEIAPSQANIVARLRAIRLGWAGATVVFGAFAIVALVSMQSGLHGDPRATNPNPGEPPYPPFLGISDWPHVTSVMSAALTVAFFGYLAWWSIRQRSPHWLLIVGIAAFFAGALDPLANWRLSPSSIHGSRTSHCRGRTSTRLRYSSRLCHSSAATRATTC